MLNMGGMNKRMESSRDLVLEDTNLARVLFGEHHRNLKRMEELTEVEIRARGNALHILGPDPGVKLAEKVIQELYHLLKKGVAITESDIEPAVKIITQNPEMHLERIYKDSVLVSGHRKPIVPKSLNQKEYIEAIRHNDIVFAIGPAGTGKTYLAMAMAVRALSEGEVSRIILTRPAVEAGERLGFLPGDLIEKVNPYLRPLYDALHDMMDFERAMRLVERGVIEVAPLAFMRGRTLNNSFVILDEAQNTSVLQMKMFLTRLGFDSRTVVTGDITQIDLERPEQSGLIHVSNILKGIAGINFSYFNEKDVVRHPLVMEIIRAYDEDERSRNKKHQY
jgi:phosphate starvation-inducible protein PhoH and related proteins